MRKILAMIAGAIVAGAAALAAPEPAAARFGAGAITEAMTDMPVMMQLAQHRPTRARPPVTRPRATASPQTSIDSTYRDPTTRGSLLNCSFC